VTEIEQYYKEEYEGHKERIKQLESVVENRDLKIELLKASLRDRNTENHVKQTIINELNVRIQTQASAGINPAIFQSANTAVKFDGATEGSDGS